ncbi:MAG: TM0106 family RecB-like putative nuclease [Patescibacteria group bacterium]
MNKRLRPAAKKVSRTGTKKTAAKSGVRKSRVKSRGPLTGTMIYKHATCPHWLYFDRFGDPKKKIRQSRFAGLLLESGLLFEKEVLAGREYSEVRGRGELARQKATLKLMKAGADLIYGGWLKSGGRVGEPDLLEKRTDASSKFGAYHYVAVEIKNVEKLSDALRLKLSFLSDVLGEVQGFQPPYGYVLNGAGLLIGFALQEFSERYRTTIEEIDRALGGECPPPHLSSSCKASPWFNECAALAESGRDLALLYNIKERNVRALRASGVATIDQAREMDAVALAEKTGISRSTLERLALQAAALIEGKHRLRGRIELPAAPVEYFFDIEGDPLRRLEYLFGLLVRDRAGERYEYFLAAKPEDEARMWRRFLDWTESLPPRFAVFHYGTYELSRLAILERRYGGSTALDRFRAALVDLNEVVKANLILPLYFYGLKQIGNYIGFARSKQVAGGSESVAFYEDWLEKGDRKKLEAVIDYNKDDVVATARLRDWLAQEQDSHQENGK